MVSTLTDREIHSLWDDIEQKHPWGPMALGEKEPTKYLLRAKEAGLVSWENALELALIVMGVAQAAPECEECGKGHDMSECPAMLAP